MKNIAFAAALVAGLVAQPLAAQQALPVDCLYQNGGAELANLITEDALSEAGFGEDAGEEGDEKLFAVMDACAISHNVGAEHVEAFAIANLANLVGGELRRRMVETGIDLVPVETLAVEFARNPQLNIETYIDSRPDQFERPYSAVSSATGTDRDLILAWVGFYVAMRSQEIVMSERLGAS